MKILFSCPRKKKWYGRFGGGWNWKLGFQYGYSTLIISLLICELRFEF